MKTFKQRIMLVATLMVIAVSGYAEVKFKTVLTGDVNNLHIGTDRTCIWKVWGNPNNNVSGSVIDDNGEKYLQLTNPSGTVFWDAQLGYEFEEPLLKSRRYKLSFKAKCDSGNSKLQFIYQNKNFEHQGVYKEFDINANDWTPCVVEFSPDYEDDYRIIINFGKDQKTFYIDDIEFGYYYEETQGTDPGTGTTPTGSLNNKMYYDGTQWCLMLEDFEGETIGAPKDIKYEYDSDKAGKATVAADPYGKSNKSLYFIPGNHKAGDYYYINVTLPDSKTLSDTYFEKLIFDIVFDENAKDNNEKDIKVKIDNTELGSIHIGTANTKEWSQLPFPLAGKYTKEGSLCIYIGGINSSDAKLFIDNIRLSVPKPTASGTCGKTTPENVNWMLDENSKTLYISGKGDIADYDVEPNNIPWNAKKDNISKIIIGEGITAIGTNNFFDHNGLESVVLPSTLEKIGDQGLYVNNENNETKPTFTFHSNPTMAAYALNENSNYTATLVLDDALSPFFAAKSNNTFNGGIQYKRKVSAERSTITLPFTPTSGLENCTFYKLSSGSENILTFEKVTKLEPNNPYIMVKTEGPNEIDFSTDKSTTILAKDSVASKTTSSPWTMHGTYSTLVINSESCKDNAYGFTGNYLKKNTGNMTVKPFRAYFTTPSTTAKDYLDVIFGGEVTGIERNEFSPEGITEIFSLDGKKHDCLQKGMNIVKMNNGSIKKIVIK